MQSAARRTGALTIALVNDVASPLALGAEAPLPLGAGLERSVAATKSALLAMGLAASLVAEWSGSTRLARAVKALPGALSAEPAAAPEAMLAALANARSLFVIGRGATLAIAAEIALKLKETSAIHAEAFSSAEVLHGPVGLIGPGFPVLAFMPQDNARAGVLESLARLASFGAAPLLVDIETHSDWPTLVAPSTEHPVANAIAALHSFYRVTETLARRRGRDPDTPQHLSKVTRTV
jgi:glucosamine--fructose-6-phosphate aminotransferase (isomerizing)